MASAVPQNERKPTLLSRVLGERIPNSGILGDGYPPRATWKIIPAIQEWGLCWRELPDKMVEIACSFKLKGNMMPGHGNVLSVMAVGEDVHVIICLRPIGNPEGVADYFAVELPMHKCTEEVCGDTSMAKGMTFVGNTPADAEDLVLAWEQIQAEREQHNNFVALDIEKGKKKVLAARKQKTKTPATVEEATEAEAVSPSKRKRKGKGKDDPNKELKLTLDEALVRGNHLTTKTKDNEVTAIYRALEEGLLAAFPYKKQRLLGVIHSDKLHIAPDELKYRKIAKDRLGQVRTMYKGYGSIRKKPEIHGIPLKRAPLLTDKGMDAVMDECPKEGTTVVIDGVTMPWWQAPNVHWYIIGGQHTVTACRELAQQHPVGSTQRKELLEFEVILVHSRDPKTLVRVSNALNLNLAEKVARETFRSCAEMGRAAWVKAGCPEPHRGGGKPTATFEEAKLSVMAHFVDEKVSSKLPLIFVKENTWELWTEVFDAWENGELIGDDGSMPDSIVNRKPLTHITKTDLTPTLGLRDSDLCKLVQDILDLRVSIKNTAKARSSGKVTLYDWCKDKKLDRIVMNEIMWTRKKYPLPCKDAGWVPYSDDAWKELADKEGYSPAVVRNIWKDVKKYVDGNNWLNGRVNAMNPTTDKSTDGKAPGVFFTTLAEYAKVSVDPVQASKSDIMYECRFSESIAEVVEYVRGAGAAESSGLPLEDLKLVVLFGYTEGGEPFTVNKHDFMDVAAVVEAPAEDDVEQVAATDSFIPLPMLLIGNSRFRDSLAMASYSSSSSWYFPTVYYQPSPRGGFLKSELEAKPMVTLTITYPKLEDRSEMHEMFKKFTGIQRPLEWYNQDADGEVDWNGGMCGAGHGILEQLLKPTLKAKVATVINIWGGGNVTEITLRNGRSVLEFVREEGGISKAHERVKGMNLIAAAQMIGTQGSLALPDVASGSGTGQGTLLPPSSAPAPQPDSSFMSPRQDIVLSGAHGRPPFMTDPVSNRPPAPEPTYSNDSSSDESDVENLVRRSRKSHPVSCGQTRSPSPPPSPGRRRSPTPSSGSQNPNLELDPLRSGIHVQSSGQTVSGGTGRQGEGGVGGVATPGAMVVDLHAIPPSEEIVRAASSPVNRDSAGPEAVAIGRPATTSDLYVGGQLIPAGPSHGEPRRGRSRGAPLEMSSDSLDSIRSGRSKPKRKLRQVEEEEVQILHHLPEHDFPNEQLSPVRQEASKRTRSGDSDSGTVVRFERNVSEGVVECDKATVDFGAPNDPQVASPKLFIFIEVQGTLIYYEPLIIKGGSMHQRSQIRDRPRLQQFLRFCISQDIGVVFWSDLKLETLQFRLNNIRWKVPEIGEHYLAFGQESCDLSAGRDPEHPGRPIFLKRLARLIGSSPLLYNRGASIHNSLIIDHLPYRNILNLPFSAVHPPACTLYSEAKLKAGKLPYLQHTMIPFLEGFLSSGLSVPDYCERNKKVGLPRCMPGSTLYNMYIGVTPQYQKGFEIPYSEEELLAMGSNS